jgi:hypothetical protein
MIDVLRGWRQVATLAQDDLNRPKENLTEAYVN